MIHWNLNALAAFVSIGGLIFGLDTGSIGPVIQMPQFQELFPQTQNTAIQGVLVATILMSAAITSSFSGSMADRISRKYTIMWGAAIAAVGSFLQAGAVHFAMLIVGRLLSGAGEGLFLSTIAVYLIEISPPNVRGKVSCMLQLFITLGIAVGYFVCYGSVSLTQAGISWRLPFIIQGTSSLILCSIMPFVPFSPRWLFQVGRDAEALKVMEEFDQESAVQEKERLIALAEAASRNGSPHQPRVSKNATILETLGHSKTRYRALLAMFLMGMQQLSGIDGVLYYAPVLFAQAGLNSRQASFLASGISGIVNVVCTIPAQFWLVDRWGRRPSSIVGGLVMSACMLIIGALYASDATQGPVGKWAVVSLIYMFVAAFSMTWAVVLKILTTEIQPSRTRATASSLAQSTNWVVNVGVALTTPLFLAQSPSGPYFLFGGCLLITSLVCMVYVPETLGKSLEEIDNVWEERVTMGRRVLSRLAISHRQEHPSIQMGTLYSS